MPSLNPDIRRAAAEQLMSLASEPRFAQALSEATLVHAVLHELKSSNSGMSDDYLSSAMLAEHAASKHETNQVQQQQQMQQLQEMVVDGFNMQLPITCLQLLVAVAQHCQEARTLLLQGSGRLDSFHPAMMYAGGCNCHYLVHNLPTLQAIFKSFTDSLAVA